MTKQAINGILLVNKHLDASSNNILQKVKRLYNAQKAGHTGSLDPKATGMLPIFFGEATKFSQYLLDADKSYIATGLLGIKTSTGDIEGDIIASDANYNVTLKHLQKILEQFTGIISQTPSMFSALKYQGKPLYHYAVKGIAVPPKTRNVEIKSLELVAFTGTTFTIKVLCSKGTYIRNLIEDIGAALGTYAHTINLHREFTAGFADYPMFTLDYLEAVSHGNYSPSIPSSRVLSAGSIDPAHKAREDVSWRHNDESRVGNVLTSHQDLLDLLLPIDIIFPDLPKIILTPIMVTAIYYGQATSYPEELELALLYDAEKSFLGLGSVAEGVLRSKKLLARGQGFTA
jgi:tRNA pseudouridine55 synthase